MPRTRWIGRKADAGQWRARHLIKSAPWVSLVWIMWRFLLRTWPGCWVLPPARIWRAGRGRVASRYRSFLLPCASLTRRLSLSIEGPVWRLGGRCASTEHGVSVYVRDPDGNLVEFISRLTPGPAVRGRHRGGDEDA